jgi:CheY-like chemotaxis protein
MIDSANLSAALSILIGNAIRFSHPNERVKIDVTTLEKKGNNYLRITVQNHGAGMPDEQVKNLFVILNNEDKNTKEAIYYKPSVQLSRAKMWIEASGGNLELTSVLNQGTTASVLIPYTIINDTKAINTVQKLKSTIVHEAVSPRCSILLIEDDIISQKVTYNALVGLGYKVDVASNGAEAIKMALKNQYDVAILDISLTDMNGIEVMRQIRAIKKDNIIFIAVTSHSSEEDEDYFVSEGAMAVLAKPATIPQLQNMIEEAMKVKIRLGQERE